jgi:hypothetical protein
MSNPILNQERVQYLDARKGTSPKLQLLPAWPRPEKELPLVNVEVTWVRFSTLNHRTKAEQMRIIDVKGKQDLFSSDPLGTIAQNEQFKILKEQKGFDDLKSDLRQRGQQEPAVITAEGVLINGNRRAAALRSLFNDDNDTAARYLRCFVLPLDASIDELVDLETELQIARDFREEYSWVNEALLIEEIFNREGKSWDRVAGRMHKDATDVKAKYEKLQQLHQLVALSNGTRHHADFVPNETAFEELARHIKNKPLEEAGSVRSAYFLGTLTGVNYRDLRHLQRPDASELVRKELEADPAVAPLLSHIENDGLAEPADLLDDVLGGKSETKDLSSVLSFFAQHSADGEVLLNGRAVPVSELMRSVQAAVNLAAEEADEQTKDSKALSAPLTRLNGALEQIERAKAALPRARTFNEWVENDFQKKVLALKAAITALEK